MLANFLNKSKPINFIGLLLFFLLGFLYTVFYDGYTYEKLIKAALFLLLFFTIFFISSFINTKNRLTLDNSYAFFLFTILILCIVTELKTYRILIEGIIYLLSLRKIYSLRSTKQIIKKNYDSGFWLGVLFILEPFSILFFLLIFLANYLHNKITVYSLFAPIIGFITPLIIYFTYHFWYDNTIAFTSLFIFDINFNIQFYLQTKYTWLSSTILFLLIFTIFFKSIKALSVNNTFRKSWILLVSNFLIVLLFSISITEKNGSEMMFMLFPVSIILANGLELISKKIIKDIILYLFILTSIFCIYFL
jgi:hypothetical protein